LGNQAEFNQIGGLNLGQDISYLGLSPLAHFGAEAHGLFADAVLNDFVDAVKGAAANKEDIGGIDLDELLMRMLAAALGRYAGHRPLENLEKSLLHAFPGNISGDGGIF